MNLLWNRLRGRAGRRHLRHRRFPVRVAYDPALVADDIAASILDGSYERVEANSLMQLLDDGERVVELGSGLGFISCLLHLRKRPADYLAIEADARLAPLFAATHRLNGVPAPELRHCIATSDPAALAGGTVSFAVDRAFWASTTRRASSELMRVALPAASLSDIIAERQATCLVADIEGGELELFEGADLSGLRKILFEIHPQHLAPVEIREIFRSLDANGFIYDALASNGPVLAFRRLATS